MRSAVYFGIALLAAACQTADYTHLQPLDPQSLVGEWRGQSIAEQNTGMAGVIVLTITRVEGDRVFGIWEQWSAGNRKIHRTQALEGTLHGNDLTIGPFQLTVDGWRMTGRRTGGEEIADVGLTKR